MSYRTPAIAIAFAVCTISAAAIFAKASTNDPGVARSRYLPQYTTSGELILPKNSMWREWVFVGSPLTPNALNDGHANFPEYHNVCIEPGSYAIYEKTGAFPEGTILFKELQLTLKGPCRGGPGRCRLWRPLVPAAWHRSRPASQSGPRRAPPLFGQCIGRDSTSWTSTLGSPRLCHRQLLNLGSPVNNISPI